MKAVFLFHSVTLQQEACSFVCLQGALGLDSVYSIARIGNPKSGFEGAGLINAWHIRSCERLGTRRSVDALWIRSFMPAIIEHHHLSRFREFIRHSFFTALPSRNSHRNLSFASPTCASSSRSGSKNAHPKAHLANSRRYVTGTLFLRRVSLRVLKRAGLFLAQVEDYG